MSVRAVIWLSLFVFGLAGVLIPISYLWVGSGLPQLESEFDVERYLKQYVEGERMAYRHGLLDAEKPVTWTRPDFAKLPKDLVALYITGFGCPTFFQTPRESGTAWGWRVFDAAALNGAPAGDGRCEWIFSNRIATAVHLQGGLKQSIAASKIHGIFQKDQLVAYDLATMNFDKGIIGVQDAAEALFHKPLAQFSLAELAEFSMVLPPYNAWWQIKECHNSAKLRQFRNGLLDRLASVAMIPEDRAKSAEAEPMACLRTP